MLQSVDICVKSVVVIIVVVVGGGGGSCRYVDLVLAHMYKSMGIHV
jgi:hypothetical protein